MKKIADKIEQSLDTCEEARLPSGKQLAQQFNTSVFFIKKALVLLQEKGLITLEAKKRPLINRHQVDTSIKSIPSSFERMYQELLSLIEKGYYAIGTTLPRQKELSHQFGCSQSIVNQVIKQLMSKQLLYKHQNSFIIGTNPREPLSHFGYSTLLIICRKKHFWEYLYYNDWHGPYFQGFVEEAEKNNIRLKAFEWGDFKALPEFDSALKKEIKSLGGRYIGALVYCNTNAKEDWLTQIRAILKSYSKKSIWYGRDAKFLPNEMQGHHCNCLLNETHIAQEMVKTVWNLGYRKVVHAYEGDEQWVEQRINELSYQFEKHPVSISFESIKHITHAIDEETAKVYAEEFEELELRLKENKKIHRGFAGRLKSVLQNLKRYCLKNKIKLNKFFYSYLNHLHKYDESVIKSTKLFLSGRILINILGSDEPTLLMSPNDAQAKSFHLKWLNDFDLKLGKDVHLISFDNKFRSSLSELSTLDPGLKELGYRSFHYILGDIPIKPDEANVLYAHPKFINKGSVQSLNSKAVPF